MSSTMNSPPSQNSNISENTIRSPQMRKELLRTVYVNAQALQNDVNTKTVENLENIIMQVDTINQEGTLEERIQNQEEVLLDSEIMTISSNVLQKCTVSLSKNISCYDSKEYTEKIKTYLNKMTDTLKEDLHWFLLSNQIMRYFKKTATYTVVLGTLRPIPKKEVVRRKTVKEAQAPTRRPEKVITLDKVEDSVEQTVVEITKIIGHYQKQHKQPLDFFALVLHPTDFGKTIENILHVSFLIRDGIIKLSIDEDGIPQVQKTAKQELAEAKENRKRRNIQNVVSLSMKEWKNLVQAYKIERPMIDLSKRK